MEGRRSSLVIPSHNAMSNPVRVLQNIRIRDVSSPVRNITVQCSKGLRVTSRGIEGNTWEKKHVLIAYEGIIAPIRC